MTYRPEIDGLRALAVVPVILFHMGVAPFAGGYVGVDVFFVISGYLITSIVLRQLRDGSFSFRAFFERRARRILPPLYVVMLVSAAPAGFLMLPDELENFGQSLVATTLFANNVLLHLTTDYWDLASEFKPLLHTWSLGVEEQFYLLYPALLLVVWRRAPQRLATLLALAVAVSLMLSQWWVTGNESAAFYLLPSRAWQLAFGALLAARPVAQGLTDSARQLLAAAGMVLIVAATLTFDEATPFPGLAAMLPTLGAGAVIVCATPERGVGRVLASRPLVVIGLMSYSLYLWHQPLLSFARISATDGLGAGGLVLVAVATGLLASLSWRFVETPFRSPQCVPPYRMLTSLGVTSVVLVGVGLWFHTSDGLAQRPAIRGLGDRAGIGIQYNERVRQVGADAGRHSDRTLVFVTGNSFARDVINMMLEVLDTTRFDLAYHEQKDSLGCVAGERFSQTEALAADVIVIASGSFDEACLAADLAHADAAGTRLFWFGKKHFGENLNWIVQVDPAERALRSNRIQAERLASEADMKRRIPPEHFVSVFDAIRSGDRVLITDDQGRLLSQDRSHLTRAGAKFIGRRIFEEHPFWSQYLRPPAP